MCYGSVSEVIEERSYLAFNSSLVSGRATASTKALRHTRLFKTQVRKGSLASIPKEMKYVGLEDLNYKTPQDIDFLINAL